jgi:hypothetical protein
VLLLYQLGTSLVQTDFIQRVRPITRGRCSAGHRYCHKGKKWPLWKYRPHILDILTIEFLFFSV